MKPAAQFAFKVWRWPYGIGVVGVTLMLTTAWQSMPLTYIVPHLLLMILEWSLISGFIWLLAWGAKTLSGRNPFFIFLLPGLVSMVTLIFYALIFSIPREGMGDLAFVIVLLFFSILCLPTLIASWFYGLKSLKSK